VPLTAPTKKVDAKNVGEFADAWKVAQGTSKARKPEEVSELFTQQNRLPQDEAIAIIKKAEGVMKKEKNLLELKPPVVVVGDIHGQFFDLVNMMSKAGMPGKGKNKTVYVFLGDYVDRGDFSCEVLIYLLSLKAEYPDSVYLLRGNHECRTVSSYFGFKEEAEAKYGLTVFNRCMAAFQAMPIAALLETQAGRFLCCHGGISPNITSLDQFAEYNRFVEPGMNGFLCDLLWSDPVKDAHEDGSDMTLGDFLSIDYLPNPARGCSYRYGFKALVSFLAVNKLVAIVRAHEVQMGGYRYHFQELTGGKGKAAINVMPPVVTIFSAPNYCARYGNKGAFLRVHANPPFKKPKDKSKGKGAGFKPLELLEPVQFTDVAHPPPMHFKNQQAEQEGQIAKTCPYMPTTFHAFVKRAVDLAQEDQDEKQMAKEKAKAKLAIAPVPLPLPKPKPAAPESTAEQESDEEEVVVVVRPKSLGRQMLQSVQSMAGVKVEDSAEVTASKADIAAKKNWKALQQLGLDKPEDSVPSGKKHVNVLEKKAVQKFEAAAENDGINEMNPMMLAEKVALAKQKIAEKHLDEDVTVVTDSPSQATGRKTLTSKRSSMRLKVGDRSRPESLTRGMKTVASEKQILATEEESAMTFTSQELLSLQLLFLLVDRQDKGLIDVEDLVAWSAEEGFAVPVEEAEICMRAVDADADGKIGFEDYLAFAARSKDKWLVSEYSNVLSQVRDMQATNASSAAAVPAGF
jgi:serine/threonine-protein phosphatase 2B catalytic subunit